MARVLRPGGRLLLADHVAAATRSARAVQRLIELVTVPLGGEYLLRRPLNQVRATGMQVERAERFKLEMDPLFREIFEHHQLIDLQVDNVSAGVRVVETSNDPQVTY